MQKPWTVSISSKVPDCIDYLRSDISLLFVWNLESTKYLCSTDRNSVNFYTKILCTHESTVSDVPCHPQMLPFNQGTSIKINLASQ